MDGRQHESTKANVPRNHTELHGKLTTPGSAEIDNPYLNVNQNKNKTRRL